MMVRRRRRRLGCEMELHLLLHQQTNSDRVGEIEEAPGTGVHPSWRGWAGGGAEVQHMDPVLLHQEETKLQLSRCGRMTGRVGLGGEPRTAI